MGSSSSNALSSFHAALRATSYLSAFSFFLSLLPIDLKFLALCAKQEGDFFQACDCGQIFPRQVESGEAIELIFDEIKRLNDRSKQDDTLSGIEYARLHQVRDKPNVQIGIIQL